MANRLFWSLLLLLGALMALETGALRTESRVRQQVLAAHGKSGAESRHPQTLTTPSQEDDDDDGDNASNSNGGDSDKAHSNPTSRPLAASVLSELDETSSPLAIGLEILQGLLKELDEDQRQDEAQHGQEFYQCTTVLEEKKRELESADKVVSEGTSRRSELSVQLDQMYEMLTKLRSSIEELEKKKQEHTEKINSEAQLFGAASSVSDARIEKWHGDISALDSLITLLERTSGQDTDHPSGAFLEQFAELRLRSLSHAALQHLNAEDGLPQNIPELLPLLKEVRDKLVAWIDEEIKHQRTSSAEHERLQQALISVLSAVQKSLDQAHLDKTELEGKAKQLSEVDEQQMVYVENSRQRIPELQKVVEELTRSCEEQQQAYEKRKSHRTSERDLLLRAIRAATGTSADAAPPEAQQSPSPPSQGSEQDEPESAEAAPPEGAGEQEQARGEEQAAPPEAQQPPITLPEGAKQVEAAPPEAQQPLPSPPPMGAEEQERPIDDEEAAPPEAQQAPPPPQSPEEQQQPIDSDESENQDQPASEAAPPEAQQSPPPPLQNPEEQQRPFVKAAPPEAAPPEAAPPEAAPPEAAPPEAQQSHSSPPLQSAEDKQRPTHEETAAPPAALPSPPQPPVVPPMLESVQAGGQLLHEDPRPQSSSNQELWVPKEFPDPEEQSAVAQLNAQAQEPEGTPSPAEAVLRPNQPSS